MSKTICDKFEIIKKIGNGTYANVYLAYDTIDKQDCAIKVYTKQDPNEHVEHILTEAMITTQLSHDNIMHSTYFNMNDKNAVLKMPLMKAEIYNDDKNNLNESFKQVVSGLNYLHSNNVIHADLKPDNILFVDVNDKRNYKICDFSCSTIFPSTKKLSGTIDYIAPELFVDFSKPTTKQTDIWSLGMTYYLLINETTFFDMWSESRDSDYLHVTDMSKKDRLSYYNFVKEHINNPICNDYFFNNILRQMLRLEPSKRINAQDLYNLVH